MPFRPPGQLTYDVLQDYLKTELSASDLTLYDEPLRPTTGIQSRFPYYMRNTVSGSQPTWRTISRSSP